MRLVVMSSVQGGQDRILVQVLAHQCTNNHKELLASPKHSHIGYSQDKVRLEVTPCTYGFGEAEVHVES
jgi:hypothetical protein